MSKRITIQIDVQDQNLDKVLEHVSELYSQLQYQVAEYDPVFNFDTAVDTAKD
jgi:hypothetical protein